jgi:DNA-binding PadR family transcriptional regulator
MTDLTRFQYDLLTDISGHAGTHGLGIKDRLEDRYGHEIHHGRLYPNLDTLADKGLITKSEADRRTNSYSATRRGLRKLKDRHDFIRRNAFPAADDV